MSFLIQVLFIAFSVVFIPIGLLLMLVPSKYPKLYAGFLRESVIEREKTDSGKRLAMRVQGLVMIFGGLLVLLFVWALR
jgi:hypothetical protein